MIFISVSKQSRPGIFTYSSMLKVTTFCDIIMLTCEGSEEVFFSVDSDVPSSVSTQPHPHNRYQNSHCHLTLKLSSPFS